MARHRDDSLIGDILDKIDFEAGDILDMPRLLDIIKRHKVTHIVHAAAFVGAVSAQNPALSIQVNVMGTVNVLEAARAFDVKRVVFTSAKGVYGPVLGEYGAPDLQADAGGSAEKSAAHLRQRQADGRADVHLLRQEYGRRRRGAALRHDLRPGQDRAPRQDGRDQPDRRERRSTACRSITRQGAEAKDDFIYNKDSAHGIYLATVADKVPSRIYNIGSGRADICSATLRRPFAKSISRRPTSRSDRAQISSARPIRRTASMTSAARRDELGFKPEYDIERGVADYIASLERMQARGI